MSINRQLNIIWQILINDKYRLKACLIKNFSEMVDYHTFSLLIFLKLDKKFIIWKFPKYQKKKKKKNTIPLFEPMNNSNTKYEKLFLVYFCIKHIPTEIVIIPASYVHLQWEKKKKKKLCMQIPN